MPCRGADMQLRQIQRNGYQRNNREGRVQHHAGARFARSRSHLRPIAFQSLMMPAAPLNGRAAVSDRAFLFSRRVRVHSPPSETLRG